MDANSYQRRIDIIQTLRVLGGAASGCEVEGRSGYNAAQVRPVLHELEKSGVVAREGSGCTTKWRLL